ncbi:MAG: peroxiredoxin [Thermoplasmata archaeon]|nr:MAG: peroxiredoxin [Thermoplasmata archaeon]
MVKLKIGDKFPDLKADSLDGERSISSFKGKNKVVYFYPRDNTPGCTIEAKDFKDHKTKFDEMNTEIIGISTNSLKSHKKFMDKYNLNFTLLSDENKILCDACGVGKPGGKSAKRTTFLVDKNGTIRHVWDKVNVKGHAEDVIDKIKELEL